MGRTGEYFAYQHYGITPDIVTVAKPLAAGLPLGAILATSEVAGCMHPGLHGTTFGGGPLSCAVAIEFLKQMEKLLGHIQRTGEYFYEQLEELRSKHDSIAKVRGLGLMLALELKSADQAKALVRELLKKGILINRTHDTVLRFLPPYIIQKKHIDEVIDALDSALTGHGETGEGSATSGLGSRVRVQATRPQPNIKKKPPAQKRTRSHA